MSPATSFFSRLPPLPPTNPSAASQIPISQRTKVSLDSTSKKPLAKIDTKRIAQALTILTGNASSTAEFSQMIKTALTSPLPPQAASHGAKNEKQDPGKKARKGYCKGCSSRINGGKCSGSGIMTSSHVYTIPPSPSPRTSSRIKWQLPPPTPYPFPSPPFHNPSSNPRHLLALTPETKSITRKDLGYKLLITTRTHTTQPFPFAKKEVVHVQIALYKSEEHFLGNPFLCKEDAEWEEPREEESLMAFGRGRGVWMGVLGVGLRWAVDLGVDGKKMTLGLDGGKAGCKRVGWKWWGGKPKSVVECDEEKALLS